MEFHGINNDLLLFKNILDSMRYNINLLPFSGPPEYHLCALRFLLEQTDFRQTSDVNVVYHISQTVHHGIEFSMFIMV